MRSGDCSTRWNIRTTRPGQKAMIPSLRFASCVDRLGWGLVYSLWQFALLMWSGASCSAPCSVVPR